MKRLLLILILTFSFQSLTKADDIRDFQIEGMSIGDSALDHFTKNEIIKGKRNYYKNNKFTDSEIFKKSQLYKSLHINYKTGDKKYIIKGISGTIFYRNNISDCYKKRDEIVKEISYKFKNIKPKDGGKVKHRQDKSGKSTLSNIMFNFKNGDIVMISCYDWSKKMNYVDHLRISFRTQEFKDFINYKAYN